MAVTGETEAQATPSGLMGRFGPAAVAICDANAEVYRYVSVRLKCSQADLTFCPSTIFRSTPSKQTECTACFQELISQNVQRAFKTHQPERISCFQDSSSHVREAGGSRAAGLDTRKRAPKQTGSNPDYHQDKRQHSFTWRLLGRPTHMRRPCKGFSPSPCGDEQADLDFADTKGKQRLWVRTLASVYPF